MSDVIRFTNGFIVQSDGSAPLGDLYVSCMTGKIVSGQAQFYQNSTIFRTIDLEGNILSPGLIDVQINGAYEVDFSELEMSSEDDGERKYIQNLDKVASRIVETGCTSFVPTIVTQKEELYAKLLRLLRPRSSRGAANILGYHAEGPFLNPIRCGAHDDNLLISAASGNPIDVFGAVYGKDSLDQEGVKMITVAPEVHGVMESISRLSARGIIVSIGHSNATLELASDAFQQGARMITHLFNAMPPIHHRDPGVIGLLGSPAITPYYGIIVDGLHSHPNTVRLAYRACPQGCVLVSDAMSMLDPHLADGIHQWREGIAFRKEGQKVTIEGTTTLAGSAISISECVANLSRFVNITLPEALLCATLHPARMLGPNIAQRKGSLQVGMDADLCILTWDGTVVSTWIGGEEVWQRSNS